MLREISPITCKQFVSAQSPALVFTVVQLCFSPPFKYIVISHTEKDVSAVSNTLTKEQVEIYYSIKLNENDGSAIQGTSSMVQF
jgi:hypothetical protein